MLRYKKKEQEEISDETVVNIKGHEGGSNISCAFC